MKRQVMIRVVVDTNTIDEALKAARQVVWADIDVCTEAIGRVSASETPTMDIIAAKLDAQRDDD